MGEKVCKTCGASLPASKGGRPADYCSTGCRKAAEYAIRRIDRRLEVLERALSNIRIGPDCCYSTTMKGKEETIEAYEAEIALQTARLRELLAE